VPRPWGLRRADGGRLPAVPRSLNRLGRGFRRGRKNLTCLDS
jgi:hypothetical protein